MVKHTQTIRQQIGKLALKVLNSFNCIISFALFQLAEGLSFLHCDANLNEGNLTADNVILTAGGQWKLAGFHFSSSKMVCVSFTRTLLFLISLRSFPSHFILEGFSALQTLVYKDIHQRGLERAFLYLRVMISMNLLLRLVSACPACL